MSHDTDSYLVEKRPLGLFLRATSDEPRATYLSTRHGAHI